MKLLTITLARAHLKAKHGAHVPAETLRWHCRHGRLVTIGKANGWLMAPAALERWYQEYLAPKQARSI